MLDDGTTREPLYGMATPTEDNFKAYKQAEKKALEIVASMKSVAAKKTDIKLALLVAVFELYKGSLPPETVGAILQGHLKQIIPFYGTQAKPTG